MEPINPYFGINDKLIQNLQAKANLFVQARIGDVSAKPSERERARFDELARAVKIVEVAMLAADAKEISEAE
jgi:hypothetical protein